MGVLVPARSRLAWERPRARARAGERPAQPAAVGSSGGAVESPASGYPGRTPAASGSRQLRGAVGRTHPGRPEEQAESAPGARD